MTKTEFQREERYVVFKVSDLGNSLKGDEIRRLAREYAEQRRLKGKEPLECVVVEKDWPEYEPTWKAIEARMTGAQPAPSFADAYQGAMEEVAIWKRRALEAETLNRKFIAGINGPMHMGEPAQPAPSIPEGWLRAIDEALVVAHIGVANESDTYEQAKAKLDNLIGFHVDVATDPAVNGGWKLVPTAESRHPGSYKMLGALHAIDNTRGASEWESYAAMLAAAPKPEVK